MTRVASLGVPLLTLLAFAGNANATLNVTVTNSPYNAAGNGTTNDRGAIQNAINDVYNAGGGVVTLPGGKTFLSGNLRLKSNVTLTISGGATLLQSQNTSDYDYSGYVISTPALGHTMNTGVIWDVGSHLNLPFIYGPAGTQNVTVNGSGIIQMTTGSDNDHTIQTAAIGFYRVNQFTIANLQIYGSHMIHMPLNSCTNGTVTGITISSPHYMQSNDDGVIMQNCQNIRVTNSYINTLDDAIQVWSSYKDPRGAGVLNRWWSSDSPQASQNIEIDHNNITGHGGMFGPWGMAPNDSTVVDMGYINVHDNTFASSGQPQDRTPYTTVSCYCDNAFHGAVPYTGNEFDPSTIHDVTFSNNTYSNGTTSLPITQLQTTGLANNGTNFNLDFQHKSAISIAVSRASDNSQWILFRHPDRSAVVRKMSADGSSIVFTSPAMGPFAGWDPVAISVGTGGPHLLWRHDGDNQASLWLLNTSDGSGADFHDTFNQGTTFLPIGVAEGNDNNPRILYWSESTGQAEVSKHNYDASLISVGAAVGPFAYDNTRWRAASLAVGSDNVSRLAWRSTTEEVSFWKCSTDDCTASALFAEYPPSGDTGYVDANGVWRMQGIAMANNGEMKVLWDRDDGTMTIWHVDGNTLGIVRGDQPRGPYTPWVAKAVGVGYDSQARIFWNNDSSDMVALWIVNDDNTFYTHDYSRP
ncbi:MAG: glycosyl hydrolase family 28 protein [Bryobacteraceae bacterium]